jgi:hypothetical protein
VTRLATPAPRKAMTIKVRAWKSFCRIPSSTASLAR